MDHGHSLSPDLLSYSMLGVNMNLEHLISEAGKSHTNYTTKKTFNSNMNFHYGPFAKARRVFTDIWSDFRESETKH